MQHAQPCQQPIAFHAPLRRDPARALQRRAPPVQSRLLREWNRADLRRVQQSQLPRPQLRARRDGGGRDRSRYRLCHGPQPAEGPGRGAAAPAPGPQEPESRRALVPGPDPDLGEHRAWSAGASCARRCRRSSPSAFVSGRRRGTMSTTKANRAPARTRSRSPTRCGTILAALGEDPTGRVCSRRRSGSRRRSASSPRATTCPSTRWSATPCSRRSTRA